MVVSVVETAMVGRLENTTVVLAAMGLGLLATWAITSVFSSLSTGTHVLVARRYGERDYRRRRRRAEQLPPARPPSRLSSGSRAISSRIAIINFFSSDPAVAAAGTGYMQWRFIGLLFFLFVVSYRGFFNGIGHTKIFMYSAIIINLLQHPPQLPPDLRGLRVPAHGADRRGLCLGDQQCRSAASSSWLQLFSRRTEEDTGTTQLRISEGGDRARSSRFPLPVSFQNILILLGFLVFVAITGMIGTFAAGGEPGGDHGAVHVVPALLRVRDRRADAGGAEPGDRRRRDLAKRYGLEAARLATYFTMVARGGVHPVPRYGDHPDHDERRDRPTSRRPILRIAGAAQIFYASGIVLAHALQAAGATVYVMVIEVLTHWVIFLPVSYLLGVTLGWGIEGAWLALPLYIVSYSLLIYWKYKDGSWLTMTV